MRPTAKSALATTQTKSVAALGPRICNPTENVQSWHLKNYSALPCKFHSYGENKSNKWTPPFLLVPIRTTVERSLRAHTYHTPGGTRSGNHLSSCELSICKVAPGKHHMSCALVQCSLTNAEVRHQHKYLKRTRFMETKFVLRLSAPRRILASARAWGNQLCFMMLDTNSGKLSGSGTNTCLIGWFQVLRGFWYRGT